MRDHDCVPSFEAQLGLGWDSIKAHLPIGLQGLMPDPSDAGSISILYPIHQKKATFPPCLTARECFNQ